jgi:hypothetical protein
VAAAKTFLAGVLLALACTGAALAAATDNPTVRINAADQARAHSSLLQLKDFGVGWTGGSKTPSKLTAPHCPGFNPKESDLVVSGHAEARFTFTRGSVIFDQDTQVLASSNAVRTDFARTVQPKLQDCLKYQLTASGKGQVVRVDVRPLGLPRIGMISAAYRATVVLKTTTGRDATIVSDFVFFGDGRLEYSVNVVAPVGAGDQLVPFETAMARILIKRNSVNVA